MLLNTVTGNSYPHNIYQFLYVYLNISSNGVNFSTSTHEFPGLAIGPSFSGPAFSVAPLRDEPTDPERGRPADPCMTRPKQYPHADSNQGRIMIDRRRNSNVAISRADDSCRICFAICVVDCHL